jgi:enterobactin synthetase component D
VFNMMPLAAPPDISFFDHWARDAHGASLPVAMCRFDLERFNGDCFAREGIWLPDAVSRSVPKRQADYFHGRLAARRALALLGQPGGQVGMGSSREPLWPEGVVGSITHAGPYAAAMAVDAAALFGVGIDLEQVVNLDQRPSLQSVVMGSAELALLESLRAHIAYDALLTLVFSAKESFFKAAFYSVKRYFDFDAVALTRFDASSRLLTFEIREHLSPRLTTGTAFSVSYDVIDSSTVFTCCLLHHGAPAGVAAMAPLMSATMRSSVSSP